MILAQLNEAIDLVSKSSKTAETTTVAGILLALVIVAGLIIWMFSKRNDDLNKRMIESKNDIIGDKQAEILRLNGVIDKQTEYLQTNMKDTLAMANGFESLIKNELFVKVLQDNHESNIAIGSVANSIDQMNTAISRLEGSINQMKTVIVEKLNKINND